MKYLFIITLTIATFFTACESSEEPTPDPFSELTEITTATTENFQVKVYAEAPLFVGYNRITLTIQDLNGNLLNTAVNVTPIMDMMTMSHSCPLEVSATESEEGKFEFATVFVMPSGEMGSWKLNVAINGTELSIPLEVIQPELPLLRSFVSEGDGESKYFVALVQPTIPEVGTNEIEIAVYKKVSMMSWPAVENMSMEMEPWMVSMDHGSPNNVNPTHMENGHYMGTVNFTMTGDWQIRLELKEGDILCGSPFFDLLVP